MRLVALVAQALRERRPGSPPGRARSAADLPAGRHRPAPCSSTRAASRSSRPICRADSPSSKRETAFEQLRTGLDRRRRRRGQLQDGDGAPSDAGEPPVRAGAGRADHRQVRRPDTGDVLARSPARVQRPRARLRGRRRAPPRADGILCLIRRDGPFVEYRIAAIKNDDTLVSTTAIGLPSAVNLDGAVALTKLSLARYDEQLPSLVAVQQQPQAADARSLDPEVRAVATATPTPAPASPPPPAAWPDTPTAQPTAQTAKVKLPPRVRRAVRPDMVGADEQHRDDEVRRESSRVPARRSSRRPTSKSASAIWARTSAASIGACRRERRGRAKIIESEITLNNRRHEREPTRARGDAGPRDHPRQPAAPAIGREAHRLRRGRGRGVRRSGPRVGRLLGPDPAPRDTRSGSGP